MHLASRSLLDKVTKMVDEPSVLVGLDHDAAPPDSFGMANSEGATNLSLGADHTPIFTVVDWAAPESSSLPVAVTYKSSAKNEVR